MRRALEAAQDLSIGIGRDLKVAVELVGKAAAGETATLKRYGIVLDEAALEGDKFEAVLGAIEARFGGQMNAYAETHAGRMERAANAWGDVKESIGSLLAGPLASAMEEISFVGTGVQEAAEGSRSWMAVLGELTATTGLMRGFGLEVEEVGDKTADLANLQEEAIAAAEEAPARVIPAWESAGYASVEAFDKEMKRLSEVAAREAEEAADAAVAAFWARAEVESSAMARDSALGLKRSDVQAAIQAAGMDLGGGFAEAFNAGMIQGVQPFEGVLPQVVGGTSTLQTFEQSGLESGDGFAGAFANAGGWKGMMSGASAAVGAFATGGAKSGVMSMVQTAASVLPPGYAQAAQAAIAAVSAVWKAIKRPSEEEIAARKSFQGIHDSAVETFGETAAYVEHVNGLVADGWDRTLAETVAGFEHAAAEAGVSHADAVELYRQYQIAVQDGNTELVASIEETYNEWTSAAEESSAAAVEAYERASNAAVSAYRTAEKEATSAYDATFEAAIEAGLGEEEATRKATQASIDASADGAAR